MNSIHSKIIKSSNHQITQSSNHPILHSLLLLSLSSLLLVAQPLSAQIVDIFCPGEDQPAFVKYFDGENMQRLVITDWKENPILELNVQDVIHQVDLGFLREENQLPPADRPDQMIDWIEPGVPVEGDMPSDCEYSKDGSIFAFIYQLSDNVIFYNANTFEILAAVQVPTQPVDLEMGENHAYVCCHSARGLVEISLDDFSVSNYISVDGAPCQVQVSPGDDTAYVACDSYRDGWIIAVDLNTNLVIFESYNPYIHNFGRLDPMGRTQHVNTKFWLSPRGNKFLAGDTTTRPTIFNAYTGLAERTYNIGGLRSAGFSPTGDTLYTYTEHDDSLLMCRINTTDNSLIDSIKAAADIFVIVDYTNMAINHDGSRVLVGDSWNGSYYLFNFNNYSCQIFDAMLDFESPIFSSSDGEYAVASSFMNIEFINFESGQIFDVWDTGIRPGWPSCISPAENKLVAGNGTFYDENEYLFSFNFKDINDIFSDTTLLCGEAPEADAPVFAGLWNSGNPEPSKIITANALSHNLSIIDFDDYLVDTIIHFDEMSGVTVVPGSDLAIVYGGSAAKTWILSLDNYEVVAILNISAVREAYVTADGLTGYLIMDQETNVRIFKINIDGASTSVTDQLTVGGYKCNYDNGSNYEHTSSAFSPDEKLLLFGYNDPELGAVINIVDAETLDLLAKVPVPDYCIYGFAFTDDSKRVMALGLYDQVPIIYLDRESSFVENYIDIIGWSFSGSYNPVDSMFYVLEQNNFLYKVDPLTGVIRHTLNTADEYNSKIAIDQRGLPLVLTSTSIIYEGEVYPMPGPSSTLNYDRENDLFIIPVPGPDVICVFNPLHVGIRQYETGKGNEISIFPNPATDQIIIKSASEILQVKVCSIAGTEVYSGDFKEKTVEISAGKLAPGVYLIKVQTITGIFLKKLIISSNE